MGKLVHLALPVRWSVVGQEGRGPIEMACTYDIHPQGARLLTSREVSVGDQILVERGRSKAICEVVWIAEQSSPLRGQFTVQCPEGKTPWEDELRHMEEQYGPILLDSLQRNAPPRPFARPDTNRRRRPRFYVEGDAELFDRGHHLAGELHQISECGARIAASELWKPGTDFRLMLNVFDVSVALKAQVKHLKNELEMGVEFQEIRRGDRPLLNYLLSKLTANRVEDFVEVEVVNEPLATAAG
jgi:hypothetical protein